MRANWIKAMPALMAAGLVCTSQVGSANAYFTTYVTAQGGYTVSWEHREEMHESMTDWNKLVTITSKEGSVPVFVRVRAYSGSKYTLTYTGSDWTDGGDGWYYYNSPLEAAKTTTGLNIAIGNIPTSPEQGENFNVIVVYESIPATYQADGTANSAVTADWSQTLTSTTQTSNVDTSRTGGSSDGTDGEEATE